jgi:hypothetical protein
MHLSTLLLATTANLFTAASAGIAIFYGDTNCKNFLGMTFPGQGVPSG